MRNLSENNNFAYLTVSLVVLLLVAALVDQFSLRYGQQLVQAFTVITLLSGTIGFRNSRLRFRAGMGGVVAVVMVVLLGILLDESGMHYLHLAILTGFYLWATWVAATQVLFSGQIDRNKIIGAICIYLLLGLIWALLYLAIAQAVPGAFNGLEQAPWYENFSAVAYYSYVTLTTLGYGDISPVVPVARFLVFMEAIAGVFYMATLVASLISIRLADIQAGNK
ncbi:MAG: potassium channel family protein [Gammaproteobacteria bacterium]